MTIHAKRNRFFKLAGTTAGFLIAAALPAAAHPGHVPMSGFVAGIQHPLSGMDHFLAMVAVGLWAGLCGGRRTWLWPAAFVASMILGSAAGLFAPQGFAAEPVILASVLVLGLATAFALRAPAGLGGFAIALFGLAHGYAHGVEMPRTMHGADFAAGFALATASLHLAGLAAAARLRRAHLDLVTRFAGAGIAIAGIALIAGA